MNFVICREEAEKELDRILTALQVEPDGVEWAKLRETILTAVMGGRILFDENKMETTVSLIKPLSLENGTILKDVTMREPTADDLLVMDKYKPSEQMMKSIALASKITGQPIGIIQRFAARDMMLVSALVSVFF